MTLITRQALHGGMMKVPIVSTYHGVDVLQSILCNNFLKGDILIFVVGLG